MTSTIPSLPATAVDPNVRFSLRELLRTCFHPSSIVLRVVKIFNVDLKHDGEFVGTSRHAGDKQYDEQHRYAMKLLVTDGDVVMHALLHRKLIALLGASTIAPGDRISVTKFEIKKARNLKRDGFSIYIGIEDCQFTNMLLSSDGENEEDIAFNESSQSRKRKLSTDFDRDVEPSSDPRQSINSGMIHERQLPLDSMWAKQTPAKLSDNIVQLKSDFDSTRDALHVMADEFIQEAQSKALLKRLRHQQDTIPPSIIDRHNPQYVSLSDDDDQFETAFVDTSSASRRREALHELESQARSFSLSATTEESAQTTISSYTDTPVNQQTSPKETKPKRVTFLLPEQSKIVSDKDEGNRDSNITIDNQPSTDAGIPPSKNNTSQSKVQEPPFHTLASLRDASSTLPRKNYSLTTLAFITWVGKSLIHRPLSPFPAKRHLKIEDPSLCGEMIECRQTNIVNISGAAGDDQTEAAPKFKPSTAFQGAITVAVYINAAKFKPDSGRLVLLRGVVMQRLTNGDVILNAYARLAEEGSGPWFIDDIETIKEMGYDVEGYLAWWENRKGKKRV